MTKRVIDVNEEFDNGCKAITEASRDVIAGAEATFGGAFKMGWDAFGGLFKSNVPVPEDTQDLQAKLKELRKRDKENKELALLELARDKMDAREVKIRMKRKARLGKS